MVNILEKIERIKDMVIDNSLVLTDEIEWMLDDAERTYPRVCRDYVQLIDFLYKMLSTGRFTRIKDFVDTEATMELHDKMEDAIEDLDLGY